MSSVIKSDPGGNNQAITCTITSLANAAAQQSTVIDNTSSAYLDILVFLIVKSHSSSTAANGQVSVYVYASIDGGTNYTEGASGTDGAITLTSPENVPWIGNINVVANSTTYKAGPFSIAKAFGGVLPDHVGIIVQNNSGAALDASIGSAFYQGFYQLIV